MKTAIKDGDHVVLYNIDDKCQRINIERLHVDEVHKRFLGYAGAILSILDEHKSTEIYE